MSGSKYRMTRIYWLFVGLLFVSNARSIALRDPKLDGRPGNVTTYDQRIAPNEAKEQHDATSTSKYPAVLNSTGLVDNDATGIITLNTSIQHVPMPVPAPLDSENILSPNETGSIGNLTVQNQEISKSDPKEGRYISPSIFYKFKVICPTLSEIIGDGPDPDRRMNQDPKQYLTFQSTPKTRPSATGENLETAGLFYKVLRGVCLDCVECDPRTGLMKTLPPGRCKSAETVMRCSNWLNCYCEVELEKFIYRDDITGPEGLEIYDALSRIPNWIKRRFPDHRFTTLDGLSLAWWTDGWGNEHPLPVGTIWRGRVYDPEGRGPPEFERPEYAPDAAVPLYGPGPSQPRRDYRWFMSLGPGLQGIGEHSYYKRDTENLDSSESEESYQEKSSDEEAPQPIEI
ncbi:hypothetical protein TWF481_005591 [Arthrobotrys musiformis]|uniref:Uncharacterized protein n=1 Tax=Arthrobotrys musiformis TaxID=47236 RepID=A0AAV9WFV8_9PEZI